MTYTTRIKEEITKNTLNENEKICELSGFIRFGAQIKNSIIITLENASIARRIYSESKEIFGIRPKITIRNQRRFRIKQIYILEIKEKVDYILKFLNLMEGKKKILPNEFFLTNNEEKIAYLEGVFLAVGTVNDPASSGYHLEMVTEMNREVIFLTKLFKDLGITAKHIKRNSKYMLYIKNAEVIGDIIKMFKATNSYFYFEDIRIYRDHKNMVNRLNNCEQANIDKVFMTANKQIKDIEKLYELDMVDLLDDKLKQVIEYRMKYKESSLSELAEIISLETGNEISKSGLNHRFRKIRQIIEQIEKNDIFSFFY